MRQICRAVPQIAAFRSDVVVVPKVRLLSWFLCHELHSGEMSFNSRQREGVAAQEVPHGYFLLGCKVWRVPLNDLYFREA